MGNQVYLHRVTLERQLSYMMAVDIADLWNVCTRFLCIPVDLSLLTNEDVFDSSCQNLSPYLVTQLNPQVSVVLPTLI